MRNRSKYFLSLLFLAFAFSTCKKYPEGPSFSLRSKTQRVIGVWEPILFTINDMDSLVKLKADSCFSNYTFSKQGLDYEHEVFTGQHNGCGRKGSWNFINNKNKLSINFVDGFPLSVFGPYGAIGEVVWDILKLKDKEMWLKTEYKGNSYEVHFNKP